MNHVRFTVTVRSQELNNILEDPDLASVDPYDVLHSLLKPGSYREMVMREYDELAGEPQVVALGLVLSRAPLETFTCEMEVVKIHPIRIEEDEG